MKKINSVNTDNKYTYFLDNASIHRTKKFMKCVKDEKMHVLYNAPYHSEINPIEYVFSLLRKKVRKCIINTKDDLIRLLESFKKSINKTHLTNIFNHAFGLLNKI